MFAGALVFEQPFISVNEYVYVVLGPVYGLATLNVPPAGEPDKAIGLPAHPLTLDAVTTGNGFTFVVTEVLAVHPKPFVTVTE